MAWHLSHTFGGRQPKDYRRLLQRLMPDGYAQDTDSARVQELDCYALILWIGRGAIDRAYAQSQQGEASELLPEWEGAYDLPNDAARDDDERRARLEAAERATAGASAARVAEAVEAVAPLASVLVNTRDEIEAAAALDTMIFQLGTKLGAAEFDDPAIRRSLARVLRRLIPARHQPVPGYRQAGAASAAPESEAQFFVTEGAAWNDAAATLGRSALRRQDASSYATRAPTNVRIKEYAGLTRLDASDLNTIQEQTLIQGANGAGLVDAFGTSTDMAQIALSVSVANTSEATVDDSIDWRDRLIFSAIKNDTSDFRPGESGDSSAGGGQLVGVVWSSMDGDTSALSGDHWETVASSSSIYFYAHTSDGSLRIYNNSGATRYFVGFCIASPDLGER